MRGKPFKIPDLPPLWETPAPFHRRDNGGPPLNGKGGPPTIRTPEIRERLLALLGEGIPLREICRVPGMPSRSPIYRWRRADPEFNDQFESAAEWGRQLLVETVSRQFDEIIKNHPPKVARRWWNLRRRQLIRVHPVFFGGPP
jgi:hypothetical protein